MTHALRVVAAIIVSEGRILACRRAPGKIGAGDWEFPGGKIEQGESPISALTREIREELNVAIDVGDHFCTSKTATTNGLIQLECYLATCNSKPVSSTDHDCIEWIGQHELAHYSWASPDLAAIDKLFAKWPV